MRVLSEVEQLKIRRNELFEATHEMNAEIDKLVRKISDLEDRWIFVPANKIKRLRYELKDKKKWREFLVDYSSIISARYEELAPDSGPKGVLQNRVTISHEARNPQ